MNGTVKDRPAAENEQRPPDWWHRDHPTFTALTGFFTGLAFVALVPALFVGLLHLVFDDETTNDLFPMVLVALAVPLGLVAFSAHPAVRRLHAHRSRRHRARRGGRGVAGALGDGAARPLTSAEIRLGHAGATYSS